MNTKTHMILVKGEDKTKQISRCHYNLGQWHVTYNNHKTFKYGYNNIIWLRDPKHIDASNHILYKNNQPLGGVKEILLFSSHIRVLYTNDFCKTYPKTSLKIEESSLENHVSANCFDYLRRISDIVNLKVEEVGLLSRQYQKMTFVSPGSVLATYLEQREVIGQYNKEAVKPIFPFGFNLSQKQATIKALEKLFREINSIYAK